MQNFLFMLYADSLSEPVVHLASTKINLNRDFSSLGEQSSH